MGFIDLFGGKKTVPPNIGSIEPSKVQKPRSFNIPSANLLIFRFLKLQMTGMLLIAQVGFDSSRP